MNRLALLCSALALLPLAAAAQPAPTAAAPAPLRVCADPDSWPLSHRDGTGLENRLAALLAQDLGVPLQTHWIPLQGRIVGATLGARVCDVLLGVPAGYARTATTRPYYRSSFVWLQRADQPSLGPLAGEHIAGLKVGVPRIRHDVAATPPGWVLQQQGAQLVGYAVEEGRMPERLAQAVAGGQVDAAVLWGPQAGWYAQRSEQRLKMTPVPLAAAYGALPVQVDVSLAVRRDDVRLLQALNESLERRRAEIAGLLREFGVPVIAR